MKDLKHLIYFENLLEDANNELVRQAQENGSIVLGYTCYHIPEVLLNVDNCISVRLRAPKTGSLDISTYYMSNYTCDYARALVERAIEGGYQFLDAMIGVDACSAMNRSMEHFEVLKVNSKEKFFVTHTDMPLKVTDYYIDSYTTQMREHVLDRLTETFGVDSRCYRPGVLCFPARSCQDLDDHSSGHRSLRGVLRSVLLCHHQVRPEDPRP